MSFFSDKIIGPLLWKYHLNNFPTNNKGINFVHEKYFLFSTLTTVCINCFDNTTVKPVQTEP